MPDMTTTMELAKRRYSAELAAYTLEQWRIARQALLATQHPRTSPSSPHEDDAEDDDEKDTPLGREAVPARVKSRDYGAASARVSAVNGAS